MITSETGNDKNVKNFSRPKGTRQASCSVGTPRGESFSLWASYTVYTQIWLHLNQGMVITLRTSVGLRQTTSNMFRWNDTWLSFLIALFLIGYTQIWSHLNDKKFRIISEIPQAEGTWWATCWPRVARLSILLLYSMLFICSTHILHYIWLLITLTDSKIHIHMTRNIFSTTCVIIFII